MNNCVKNKRAKIIQINIHQGLVNSTSRSGIVSKRGATISRALHSPEAFLSNKFLHATHPRNNTCFEESEMEVKYIEKSDLTITHRKELRFQNMICAIKTLSATKR